MANNLKISVVATLNTGLSIGEINRAISGIEKKVNALKLKIEVNQSVLSTLNSFAKQMERVSDAALKTGATVASTMKQADKAIKEEARTVDELTERYKKLTNEVNKYKKDGALKSTTSTYQDDKGNGRVINTNAKGEVTSYKDIENITKFQREQEKLRKSLIELGRTGKYTTDELRKIGQGINLSSTIKELSNLQSRMGNMKLGTSLNSQTESVRQSLKKMYDQGVINENFFRNFNKVINSSKNVGELNKIQQALQRVNEAGKNKNLQQGLLSQAQTLLGTNSKKLDVSGVNNLIASLKNIKPNAASATNELQRLQTQLREYTANARVAHEHTMTFGSALRQALAGFSLWSLTAQLVYAPIRALQDMTSRLITIDTLMTDLRRVMELPDFKFTEILQNAVDTSDKLSSKLTDVLGIMGSFGRMGFNDNQLVDITKTAQVLQNISDLDANSSVDTLTSAMLNFNISAKDSISIADKLNEVDLI
jgi:hypothetical protein